MRADHEEQKVLMSTDRASDFEEEVSIRSSPRRESRWFTVHMVLLAIQSILLLLTVYTLWTAVSSRCEASSSATSTSDALDEPYSPAFAAVEYEVRVIDTHKKSDFTGEPRPEVDQAWSDLLSATIITMSEDEMRKMNKTSAVLNNGDGYAGYMEAYHMLHCVKRMYQFRHLDYYTDIVHDEKFNLPHWDHCVEVLRQGVMCHADLTINTLIPKREHELEGFTTYPRKCTKWNLIQDWAEARSSPVDRNHQADFVKAYGQSGNMGPADLV